MVFVCICSGTTTREREKKTFARFIGIQVKNRHMWPLFAQHFEQIFEQMPCRQIGKKRTPTQINWISSLFHFLWFFSLKLQYLCIRINYPIICFPLLYIDAVGMAFVIYTIANFFSLLILNIIYILRRKMSKCWFLLIPSSSLLRLSIKYKSRAHTQSIEAQLEH